MNDPRVIVALDFDTPGQALRLAEQLNPNQCKVKVGTELWSGSGAMVVQRLVNLGYKVFLDLKLHDIPTTVERTCRVLANLGIWAVNVHGLGGPNMVAAARKALIGYDDTRLFAVTVLTSMDEGQVGAVGLTSVKATIEKHLQFLPDYCDGIICSPKELKYSDAFPQLCFVTPGIRPAGSNANDQARFTTPKEAIDAGADYIVVGRPITAAADPVVVLDSINKEIGNVL